MSEGAPLIACRTPKSVIFFFFFLPYLVCDDVMFDEWRHHQSCRQTRGHYAVVRHSSGNINRLLFPTRNTYLLTFCSSFPNIARLMQLVHDVLHARFKGTLRAWVCFFEIFFFPMWSCPKAEMRRSFIDHGTPSRVSEARVACKWVY